MSVPVGVLISGRGSNMQALVKACAAPDFPAHIALVIANCADSEGLKFAHERGIKIKLIEHTDFETREAFEAALHTTLSEAGVDIVCLAGFMRLLGAGFVRVWKGKLINIHPSLLPAFRGLNTHRRALESGVKQHGCTVHFVSVKMDEGPIIGQTEVPVYETDTVDTLSSRVLAAEHQLYPKCLQLVAQGDFRSLGFEGR